MSYLYLASPYTHEDPRVRQWRYEQVRNFAAFLINRRTWVFCPIAHSHDMCLTNDMPVPFEFWNDMNKSMIFPSMGIIVFELDGWRTSRGVKAELEYAMEIGRPIIYSGQMYKDYVIPPNPFL